MTLLCAVLSFLASPSAQAHLGNMTSYTVDGRVVTLWADTTRVRLVFFASDVLRVDFLPRPSTILDSSFVVVRDTTEPVNITVADMDSLLEIATSSMVIRCTKTPLGLSYYNSSKSLLFEEGTSGGFAAIGDERRVSFKLGTNDHFYGTGERGTDLDKRGQTFGSSNETVFGYSTPLSMMNINVPFLATTNGYALYFEDTYGATFDLGSGDPSAISYTASGGELAYFLIVAPTVPAQLDRYTWLTGRQPLPPRWAFGYLQSKFGYETEAEAQTVVQTMRQEQIPCDAIILDLYWYQYMGDLTWNSGSWPTPFQMTADFLKSGFRTIVITEPYVTGPSPNFTEGSSYGYLAKDSAGQTYRLANWWSCGCDAGLVDLTNPAAQAWWWNKHVTFLGSDSAGVAGLWTDLGEPEQHPSDMRHSLGSAAKVHNIYNLLWARTVFEGYNELRPNSRLFNLTRSGYAGIQRYGVIPWSADVGNTFGGLSVQLPMLLNMGMSGLAYHNSDIGGFCCGATSAELYVRWMQYGTFCPICRAHGYGRSTEPWGYGTSAETIARDFIRLRYQLLPYIYTMAHENSSTGMPLARPLFFADASSSSLLDLSAEYLWGDAFLVSPVVEEGQAGKSVYLPSGSTWIDYWAERRYEGGQSITVSTPLETMPLFVRAGSIIPMQPVMDYSDQRPLDTLLLAVYPWSSTKGTFSLYEDDGKTPAYQSGEYAETVLEDQLTGSGADNSLTIRIGTTTGTYAGRPAHRVYLATVHGIAARPSGVTQNGQPLVEFGSYAELRQGGDGFCFDSLAHHLFVQMQTVPDSSYTVIAAQMQLTDVALNQQQPSTFILDQNYPNPFNPSTVISGQWTVDSWVKLVVYDMLGREVATLANGRYPAGRHSFTFDARGLASGVYFYRLTTGSFSATRKMMVVK